VRTGKRPSHTARHGKRARAENDTALKRRLFLLCCCRMPKFSHGMFEACDDRGGDLKLIRVRLQCLREVFAWSVLGTSVGETCSTNGRRACSWNRGVVGQALCSVSVSRPKALSEQCSSKKVKQLWMFRLPCSLHALRPANMVNSAGVEKGDGRHQQSNTIMLLALPLGILAMLFDLQLAILVGVFGGEQMPKALVISSTTLAPSDLRTIAFRAS